MKTTLTEYLNQYGLSGVLEVLMVVCDDKAREDEKLRKRYDKAAVKLYQLSKQKFVQGL
jgi:hypothetical protein